AALPPGIAGAFGLQPGITPLRGSIGATQVMTVQGVSRTFALVLLDAASRARVDNILTTNLVAIGANDQQEAATYWASIMVAHGRVHLKNVGTGAVGEFVYTGAATGTVPHYMAPYGIGLAELATTEPGYLAMPATSTVVDFYVWSNQAPTPKNPLLIADTHPAQIWKDILDGYYGFLWQWVERE